MDEGNVSNSVQVASPNRIPRVGRSSLLEISPNKSHYWIPVCDDAVKPCAGMIFDTVDEGINMYRKYAALCGFVSRLSTTRSDNDGVLELRYVVCNKEGGKNTSNSTGQRDTVSDRCGCMAKVVLSKMDDGKFLVRTLTERHNHRMMSTMADQFCKTNFNFGEGHQEWVMDCGLARIGSVKSYKLYEKIMGGPAYVDSTVVQFKNFRRDLTTCMNGSDAQMVVNLFHGKQERCSAFYFNYNVDDCDRLTMLFWADPMSRRNCSIYGEIVAFDATYKTNRYDMVFAPFTGVNNHNKCVTFAAALILKEDVRSYEWVLENYKKAMGKDPKIMVTDQDPALIVAVRKVFPDTLHRFCMWHIMTKVTERVGSVLNSCPEFRNRLHSIVWNNWMEPGEFEEKWNALIVDYELEDNDWLKNKFEIRKSWIPAYFRDILLGGLLRTTSVSESQNSFFKCYSDQNLNLVELMVHFDSAMEHQRYKHNKLTVDQESKVPDMVTLLSIEKHCARIFTLFAFKKIQDELLAPCRVVHVDDLEDNHLFTIKDGFRKDDKTYTVDFRPSTGYTACSCAMFMRIGIPCRHSFLALKDMGVEELPGNLILDRWTKAAALPATFSIDGVLIEQFPELDERKRLLGGIRSDFNACVGMIRSDSKRIEEFARLIKDYKESITTATEGGKKGANKGDLMEAYVGVSVPPVVSIFDPEQAHNKGSGKRFRSGKEKAVENNKKGSRKCGKCGQYAAHNSRTCKEKQVNENNIE